MHLQGCAITFGPLVMLGILEVRYFTVKPWARNITRAARNYFLVLDRETSARKVTAFSSMLISRSANLTKGVGCIFGSFGFVNLRPSYIQGVPLQLHASKQGFVGKIF